MTSSLPPDASSVYLDPSVPPVYLRRVIVSSLHRRGADGAEAGVLAEMERLLQRHVKLLFSSARDHAALANRSVPNALDVLSAHAESSHTPQSLLKESKKQQRPLRVGRVAEPTEVDPSKAIEELSKVLLEGQGQEAKTLVNAFQGAPPLPPAWTYPSPPISTEEAAPAKATSAALNFVKATVAEADVDPELGIVHYRKAVRRR